MLNAGALPGVYTMQEPKRFYPAGQLASPLSSGWWASTGQGLSGLEYKYNGLLEGKPGKLVEDMDPAGGQIPGGVQEYQAPVRGDDLVLSIDEPLQYEAEQALARAIVAAQADSGMALIMDSRTGDLLAVAQLTMPTPSEPATMREPPALPGLVRPARESSTTAPRALASTGVARRRQRSTGRGAVRLGVHHCLRTGFSGKTGYGFGRPFRPALSSPMTTSTSPTLTTSPAAFSATPGPIPRWTGASPISLPIPQISAR